MDKNHQPLKAVCLRIHRCTTGEPLRLFERVVEIVKKGDPRDYVLSHAYQQRV
jgi:hypothetical protein